MTLRARRHSAFRAAQARFAAEVAELVSLAIRRFEADVSLRETGRRYRNLVEGTSEVPYLLSIAPTLRVQYVSPAVLGLTGYSPEEFYSNPGLFRQLAHPDDMPAIRGELAKGGPLRGTMILRLVGRDGRRVWVAASRSPIYGANGRVIAIQGMVRDINDRIAEREARSARIEVAVALMQGRRLEDAFAIILRHLRYLLDADEVLLASESPRDGRHRIITRVGANDQPKRADSRSDNLVRRALRAGQPVVHAGSVATVIPWAGERNGILVVHGITGSDLNVDQATAPVDQFAREVATAVELWRLSQERIQRALDDDRSRIARELHDGVVQTLFAAALQLQMHIESLHDETRASVRNANAGIREAIQDIRQYVFDLEPSLLAQGGLGPSLQQLAVEFETTTGVSTTVDTDYEAVTSLEPVATHILQIAREALSNVRRHAEAQHVGLLLRQAPRGALLEIRDDGQGFNPEAAQGLGLRNLRTRARLLGGKLELRSEPGKGSTVRVTIPPASGELPRPREQLPA